jgi:hypothetical protein
MEIWDLHCHLSGVPGETPEARLGKLLEFADRMGVARLCVFMGMEFTYDPSPEKLRQENDEVLRAIRAFFAVFGGYGATCRREARGGAQPQGPSLGKAPKTGKLQTPSAQHPGVTRCSSAPSASVSLGFWTFFGAWCLAFGASGLGTPTEISKGPPCHAQEPHSEAVGDDSATFGVDSSGSVVNSRQRKVDSSDAFLNSEKIFLNSSKLVVNSGQRKVDSSGVVLNSEKVFLNSSRLVVNSGQ